MKIYLVGGAVRDELLGLPVKERDWVVVGAQVKDMLSLGYQQVGKDFPVFLHPQTHEEYALARMERKVKPGYKGFTFDTSPEVTLEEDLKRRDLTINAMAQDRETGAIIDPYGGQADLKARLLRHVSSAFSEDPVRILRVARFLARYAKLGFTVAPETMALMQSMVKNQEAHALVAERVWKELERAMAEPKPDKFFDVLEMADALPVLFPELANTDAKIDRASRGWQAFMQSIPITQETAVRLAALMHDLPDAKAKINSLYHRYRLPNQHRELALLVARHYPSALAAKKLTPEELLDLFAAIDVYRRESRFNQFLLSCCAIAQAQPVDFDANWLAAAANVAKSVDVSEFVQQGLQGADFAEALRKKRLAKIREWV